MLKIIGAKGKVQSVDDFLKEIDKIANDNGIIMPVRTVFCRLISALPTLFITVLITPLIILNGTTRLMQIIEDAQGPHFSPKTISTNSGAMLEMPQNIGNAIKHISLIPKMKYSDIFSRSS